MYILGGEIYRKIKEEREMKKEYKNLKEKKGKKQNKFDTSWTVLYTLFF